MKEGGRGEEREREACEESEHTLFCLYLSVERGDRTPSHIDLFSKVN
jgi:hypothetical protein